jgi:hypothetical protein
LRAASGGPFTITSGRDNSLTGNGYDRPDLVGIAELPSDRPRDERIARYFNPQAFTQNQTGKFGNSGRNIMYGPGQFTMDLGLLKNFRIWEPLALQFRGELFNALNRVNLRNPVTLLTSPIFGRIADADNARMMQFGLKLNW